MFVWHLRFIKILSLLLLWAWLKGLRTKAIFQQFQVLLVGEKTDSAIFWDGGVGLIDMTKWFCYATLSWQQELGKGVSLCIHYLINNRYCVQDNPLPQPLFLVVPNSRILSFCCYCYLFINVFFYCYCWSFFIQFNFLLTEFLHNSHFSFCPCTTPPSTVSENTGILLFLITSQIALYGLYLIFFV